MEYLQEKLARKKFERERLNKEIELLEIQLSFYNDSDTQTSRHDNYEVAGQRLAEYKNKQRKKNA